jgi:hypothetical protein
VNGLQVFLFPIREQRLALLDADAEEDGDSTFAEPVRAFSLSKNRAFVALIVGHGRRVIRAAVAHRGYSAGTALSQIQLTNAQKILSPFRIADLPRLVKKRFQSRVTSVVNSFGLLTPRASEDLLRALVASHPELETVMAVARAANETIPTGLTAQQQLRLQEEKDAAYTAMLIAGFDRKEHLMQVSDSVEADQWFLDSVTDARLREDPMILNDLNAFPGFDRISEHVTGAVRFDQQNLRLTVVLVNRQPLEEVTGTDLIYFNETFRAFVMVQYKAMEPDENGHVFRLPNEGLKRELRRMEEFEKRLTEKAAHSESDSASFRFSASPFFLKFWPRIVEQLANRELVPGLYFPLDHWSRLSDGDVLKGKRHGKALRYDKASPVTNADRYLNNTEFANLVRGAWVGTSAAQSDLLQTLVENTLRQGRSVTVAVAGEAAETGNEMGSI